MKFTAFLESLRRFLVWPLWVAGAIALLVTVGKLHSMNTRWAGLSTAAAPEGMVSLQMPRDAEQAREIVEDWSQRGLLSAAQQNLRDDYDLIPWYMMAGLLLGLAVACSLPPRGWCRGFGVVATIALVLVGGLVDACAENPRLERLVSESDIVRERSIRDGTVEATRTAARVKFTALAMLTAGFLVGIAVSLKVLQRRLRKELTPPDRFRALFEKELGAIPGPAAVVDPDHVEVGPAGEPRIKFVARDLVGLALSGGGIRSATFNLGLLQALDRLGILELAHYLSTVSGGGYIGGWLSSWRLRVRNLPPAQQATAQPSPLYRKDGVETDELRHLREFSNFLSPRWGFFESEMWNGLVVILMALVASLSVTCAVIAGLMLVWLAGTAHLAWNCPGIPLLSLGLPMMYVLFRFEIEWRRRAKADPDPRETRAWLVLSLAALPLSVLLWQRWIGLLDPMSNGTMPIYLGDWTTLVQSGTLEIWFLHIGAESCGVEWHFSPRLFDGAVVWLAGGFVFTLVRLVVICAVIREGKHWFLPALDRVTQRLLGLGLAWGVAASLWEIGVNLRNLHPFAPHVAAGGAVGSSLVFAKLRNWMTSAIAGTRKGGFAEYLKPLLPQALSQLAVALAVVLVVAGMVTMLERDFWSWLGAAVAVLLVMGVALLFHPAEVGLHMLYRDRLARAYLGASNPAAFRGGRFEARRNRQTDLRNHDDFDLAELAAAPSQPRDGDPPRSLPNVQPLHLICCTANDQAGDQLANLSRGGRSATLSCLGMAIGDHWAERKGLRMGAAMTASAAAFNSQMGSLSMRVGPTVAFLMTALNLRLGYWMRHPLCERPEFAALPGELFLREMFDQTKSGTELIEPVPTFFTLLKEAFQSRIELPVTPPAIAVVAPAPNASPPQRPVSNEVHLSDGGHFENLALYELVRRHCRFIIVSDCGEDPKLTFEDFGNAVRRIREDFSVEIDIDLDPLKPDKDGKSRQHMVVGTIRYDRATNSDNGILLYFKPTLTGDESCDITNYKSANPAFPHEFTGDQFYDEAQWESYRRLGEHAGWNALRDAAQTGHTAQAIFTRARDRWYPTPADLESNLLRMTERYAAFEEKMRSGAPSQFIHHIFPELGLRALGANRTNRPLAKRDDAQQTLELLLEMLQLMEDVWLSCHLESHFNHPLNLGWMNLFQRWGYTASFQKWWPFLSPMYSPGFRGFVERRLLNPSNREAGRGFATVRRLLAVNHRFPDGLAWKWWSEKLGKPTDMTGYRLFTYQLLAAADAANAEAWEWVQVALARVEASGETPPLARWSSADFFVPPSLWGTGIGSRFLRELLSKLKEIGVRTCRVRIVVIEGMHDAGSRQEMLDNIEFYKSVGFIPLKDATADSEPQLELDLTRYGA